MKTYLVGGAVRDELLGEPVTERDWVVVGSTPKEMLDKGYQQVGKSFPVFLHPRSREEYALARTERKTGSGHTGFDCDSSPDVTLEQDLGRRDLTVNAIARDENGQLIDVHGGLQDVKDRVLRHIGEAFAEDPLRVLRIARFAARYAHLGFHIAPATLHMCRQMVERGDLTELTAERVFGETEKALQTKAAHVYFDTLVAMGADKILWPEITESDIRTLASAEEQAGDQLATPQKFAVLFKDTPPEVISDRCKALRTPDHYRQLAVLVSAQGNNLTSAKQLAAEVVVDLLNHCDAFRKPDRFQQFLALMAILAHQPTLVSRWSEMLDIAKGVTRKDVDAGLRGPEIGRAIASLQTERISNYLSRSR